MLGRRRRPQLPSYSVSTFSFSQNNLYPSFPPSFICPCQLGSESIKPPTHLLARSLAHSLTRARLSFVVSLNQPAEVEAAREGWKRGGRDQSGRHQSRRIRGRPRLHHSPFVVSSVTTSLVQRPKRQDRPPSAQLSSALGSLRGLLPQYRSTAFRSSVVLYQIRVLRIDNRILTWDPEKGSDSLQDRDG